MIVITSGQYLKLEIQNEVGKLPPAFSFMQNKRLYDFQIKLLKKYWKDEKIILSLPESFEIPFSDQAYLNSSEIVIIRCNEELLLGENLSNIISEFNPRTLKILHGDTFFEELHIDANAIAVSKPVEIADWHAFENNQNNSNLVWAGFFNLDNPENFDRNLKENNYIFHDALNKYSQIYGVKEIEINPWYDFGHIEGFHKSREKYTTERSFNDLSVSKYEVTKSSANKNKIKDEYDWFNNTPDHLKKYLPNVFAFKESDNKSSYSMNYVNGFSISELMLFSNLNEVKWNLILNEVHSLLFHQKEFLPANAKQFAEENFNYLFLVKNMERLDLLKESSFLDKNETIFLNGLSIGSIDNIFKDLTNLVKKFDPIPAYVHGDLCLSNIIYKARGNTITIIDPRGSANIHSCCVGDQRYDIAKLAHSIFWDYDRVICDDISFSRDKNNFIEHESKLNYSQEILKKLCLKKNETSIMLRSDIKAITALLFMTMIPLHADSRNRQNSLFGIGLKIYQDLVEQK